VTPYAESSALLAWLLDEPTGRIIRKRLANAEVIIASDLTLVECDRVVIRAAVLGDLTEADAADRRAHLTAAAAHWNVLRSAGMSSNGPDNRFLVTRFGR
jgi:hypothetical protein